MDPPSFTKQICREKLNNITEGDLSSMQEMIVEKAQKINLKLTKSGSVAALGIDDYAEVDEGEGPAPESKPDAEEEEK